MKYETIEELLQYHEKESKIFIPNEIFEDLQKYIHNSSHLSFTYSYYYLISWLYRYAKYGNIKLNNDDIKEILGYNRTTKGLNYITKKNGLTDQIGYTITYKDFPLSWTFNQYQGLEFFTLNQYIKQELKGNSFATKTDILEILDVPKKYTIKYPVKAFERIVDSNGHIEQEGTFFEFDNTHCIVFEIFMYCMDNEKIGTTGFYLYSYIKMKNDKYKSGWDISIENMASETGLPEKTLLRYLDQLKKYRMIKAEHNQEYFCLALEPKDRKANTYHVYEFDFFLYKPQSYKKMKVISTKEYFQQREKELENLFGNTLDISENDLPY